MKKEWEPLFILEDFIWVNLVTVADFLVEKYRTYKQMAIINAAAAFCDEIAMII